MKLLTVPEMLAVERASDAAGHSYAAMMERAGNSLAKIVHDRYGGEQTGKAAALVGKGNNGGDALVAVTYLIDWGWQAVCILVGREEDELVRRARQAGAKILSWTGLGSVHLGVQLQDCAVVLDGVLGTGIRLPLRPPVDAFLAEAGASLPANTQIIAVDVPSGVDSRSGDAAPETLPADLTVTMAAAKTGQFSHPAAGLCGELVCGDIGLPEGLPEWSRINRRVVDLDFVRTALPDRPPDAHKGTFGTAVVCAGSRNFVGAALLSGQAAFRSGAGLVTTACAESVYRLLAGQFPESTWLPLPESDGALNGAAAGALLAGLAGVDALLFGPGFGRHPRTGDFVRRLLDRAADLPSLVVDADGLKLLAEVPDWAQRLPAETVLTPHPGEMAVLTGKTASEIQADRLAAAEYYASAWGHVVVLKGAFTLVAAPDGRTALIPVSTPALARAGTGDVLAGLITGLRAQGVGAYEAAAAGAWLHGRAGLHALAQTGHAAAVLAGDVLAGLAAALAETRLTRRSIRQ